MWLWLALLILLAPPGAEPFQARVEEGLAALERNDAAAARKSLEQATRLQPASAPAWFLLAQACARLKDMKAALESAHKAGEHAEKDKTILYNLAVFYLEAGQPDDSIASGRRALVVEDSYEVRTVLGQAYEAKRDWQDAIVQYSEARKLEAYSEDAIFHLAQAFLHAQDFAGATAVLEEGRKVFDKSPQIELALGVSYYGQRRFADAVDRFLRVMQLDPNIPQPYYFLGRVLEHASKRLPEVVEKARWFEQAHPQSPLGYILHARGLILESPPAGSGPAIAEAEILLRKALSIKEDAAEAHYLLGTVLERKKDYAGAAVELERSIALNAKDAAPHFQLARVYARLGRESEAERERKLHEKLSQENEVSGKPDLK